MPERAIVTGIVLILITALLVFAVEMFVPLSVKADMNAYCRNALLCMEKNGGITDDIRQALIDALQNRGLTNITVTATSGTRYGELLNLNVRADYVHSRLTGIFTRTESTIRMEYSKVSVARKVVN